MYPDDYNKLNNLYYSVNGEIRSLKDLTSISIEVSEEDQAKLWALFEGLEIVKEE
jgi:hypothetical protein